MRPSGAASHPGLFQRPAVVSVVLLLAPLLLSLDRPVMIDDALFLRVAAQILRDPPRPFSVNVNWYGWDEPLWGVFKNPPGLSYWLAGVQAIGGPSEVLWHLSLLPFAIAAVLATLRLAQRFTSAAGWTTGVVIASPAFLVSGSTLMADVPALALTLWGLVLWIDGSDGDSRRARLLGALLTGVAVIVKYTAALSVVTLLLYTILCAAASRRRSHVVDLWPAIVPAAAWAVLTLAVTGRVHLIDALLVRGGGLDPNPGWFGHRVIALLTFVAGAGMFPALFLVTLLTSAPARALAIAAGLIGIAAAVFTPTIWSPQGLLPGAVPLVGILAAFGACALLAIARAAFTASRSDDRDTVFLAVSIALHVVFLWFWSWTVAVRFVLPMLVPMALLLARMLQAEPSPVTRRAWLASATVVALALSVGLLRADRAAGDFHRRAIAGIGEQARREPRAVLFTGGWGFSYYAEQAGMRRLDVRSPQLAPGNLVLQPYFVANNEVPAEIAPRLAQRGNIPAPSPALGLHTMNLHAGAGFYSSVYGPLPFFRAPLPADGVIVWMVSRAE